MLCSTVPWPNNYLMPCMPLNLPATRWFHLPLSSLWKTRTLLMRFMVRGPFLSMHGVHCLESRSLSLRPLRRMWPLSCSVTRSGQQPWHHRVPVTKPMPIPLSIQGHHLLSLVRRLRHLLSVLLRPRARRARPALQSVRAVA